MDKAFRGIFSIPQTPFNEAGDLLWEDLQCECDWIVRAGAHGLVYPVMASEYTVLSFPERVQGMNLAARAVNGRIPVVIGVADTSNAGAAALAAGARAHLRPHRGRARLLGRARDGRRRGGPHRRPREGVG